MVHDAERRVASAERTMSATLQRSLLTPLPVWPGVRLATRNQPAAARAHVGGDWNDAFTFADGTDLLLVVGDVAGHDRHAAAAMAQARNLLRNIAHRDDGGERAGLLTRTDRALNHDAPTTWATAVLARVTSTTGSTGRASFRWTDAGHLPPIAIYREGRVELLSTTPDILLGVHPDADRHDHSLALDDVEAVVLYTDGLIERRDVTIDDTATSHLLERRSGQLLRRHCRTALRRPARPVRNHQRRRPRASRRTILSARQRRVDASFRATSRSGLATRAVPSA